LARPFDVAVMHDFFIDRLVETNDLEALLGDVRSKASSGGGGIHGVVQSEIRGGNAVNLAHALATLGLRTLLLTHSDDAHEAILRRPFDGLDAEVRTKPKPPGLTVAFEERVNVMLGHVGGAGDFGPDQLDPEDWRSLASAKVVCSVNWAANARGTELLTALRKELGPDKLIFFDPADFRDRAKQFAALLKVVRQNHLVDWMSMNEQEVTATAKTLGIRAADLEKVCRLVAKQLGVELEVHTSTRSLSASGDKVVSVKAARAKPRRYTGAGDVWDAASIYGRLEGMKDAGRLKFANAAAGLYITSTKPLPPTRSQVLAAVD
jgi:ribokinase